MRKQRLIVLTRHYPFGNGESFCEAESAYWFAFDEVFVCPFLVEPSDRDRLRQVAEGVRLIDLQCERISKLQKLRQAFSGLFHGFLWREMMGVLIFSPHPYLYIRRLFNVMIRMDFELERLLKLLPKADAGTQTIVYSYWLNDTAYTAVRLKRKLNAGRAVARAHGSDIYEEMGIGYIPFHKFCMHNLDAVFSISEYGKAYLRNKYPEEDDKVSVMRLGTQDYGMKSHKRQPGKLCVVSCSNCIEVKRVDKIIEALSILSLLADLQIEWTHYGDGGLRSSLELQAAQALGSKVEYRFAGAVPNTVLMQRYQEEAYDVFINTSASEGIPVSIMEAMSFGIPVIATDVGGTSELVIDGQTGFLLRSDFSVDELAAFLQKIIEMPEQEYQALRQQARNFWQGNYCAKSNYSQLTDAFMKQPGLI